MLTSAPAASEGAHPSPMLREHATIATPARSRCATLDAAMPTCVGAIA
jgi:hypothetical protein